MTSKPPGSREPTVLQVFVFKDGRFFGTECFVEPQIVMGRSPDADLLLDDDLTSRSHASVEIGPEGVVLQDLDSSNGTYVNGEPIEQCYIGSRDEVGIGSFTLKFKVLSRRKPKVRFRDETRVVDQDRTEVVAKLSAPPPAVLESRPVPEPMPDPEPEPGPGPEPGPEPGPGPGPGPGPEPDPEPVPEPEPPIALMEPEPPRPEAAAESAADDYDDYGDEDDDQRDFVEPFSLLNNLIREDFAEPRVSTADEPVMEVIGYTSDKEILSFEQVSRGKKHRVGPDRFVLAHYKEKAAGRILFSDEFGGGVITGGRTVPLDDLKNSANQVRKRRGKPIYACKLYKGDYANLLHEGGGSFVRFVDPPRIPPPRFQFRIDPLDLKIFSGSFLGLALAIVLLGIFGGRRDAVASVDMDRFAKIAIQEIEMEKPEEEVEIPLDRLPQPDKKEEEKVKEEPEKEPDKEKPAKRPRRRSKKKDSGGGGAGMMAALGNLSQKKSSRNIVAAVSNLDAVRVPGGRSRYKVSGLVTKLPTSSVVTSRGRGVGVKGGIELLAGGKGRGKGGIGPGALGGGRTGRRGIGGVVFKAPKRKMKVRGTLSREAIANVVRKHLREIQYCYERNLMLNPKLAGKLIMEWTISTSGSISVVKTKTNTMATPAVAMCVSARIKRWKFPKPKGGVVIVTYPFIFNSIGF